MAGNDFTIFIGKETVFVIFSKSWFLKLPDKGMESCKTLKAMPQKENSCFRVCKSSSKYKTYVHSAIFYVTRNRSKRDLCNKLNRKVQGVPQSQTAANPRYQGKEKNDKN